MAHYGIMAPPGAFILQGLGGYPNRSTPAVSQYKTWFKNTKNKNIKNDA